MKRLWWGLVGFIGLGVLMLYSEEQQKVPYPKEYRSWVHVKSMVIEAGHPLYESFGGIHHIYANPRAMAALKNNKQFADGSILIFDLLEARHENNAVVEGKRKVLGVMIKDKDRYARTGGWGFEAFQGDTRQRLVTDAYNACFSCHMEKKGEDFVFTRWRP